MGQEDFFLFGAAALNIALVIAWMFWQPRHHRALASMMGFEWRGRKPLLPWKQLLKRLRIIKAAAGAGLFALREVLFALLLAALTTGVGFAVSALAIDYAATPAISLDGRAADGMFDVALALVSHIASQKLALGFSLMHMPSASISGNLALSILILTLFAVVASVALKATAEFVKCGWYAALCTFFPKQAQMALERREDGWMSRALGIRLAD